MDRIQIFIVSVMVVILSGALGFWFGRAAERRVQSLSPSGIEIADTSALALVGATALLVNDQAPGTMVDLAMVNLTGEGWVAIHEDRDGKPGNILGARLFYGGANQSGEVELLRRTEEGRIYYAMLHGDDGDRKFDQAKDLPITDQDGNMILMRFLAVSGQAQP